MKKRLLTLTVFILSLLVPALLCSQAWAVDVLISQLLDAPDPAIRGGQITYSIFVANNANDTAHNVVLTFPLPATTSFVSVSDPRCSHDGGSPGTVTCTFGDLVGIGVGGPIIQTDTIIRTTGATPATIDVTGSVTTSDADTNPANNTLTQNTTIDDGADLVIAKTDSPDPQIAGGNITYSISVTNNGPNSANNIVVTDTLSTNMTYVSASGSGWSCSHNGVNPGGIVTCTRSSIANGATAPSIALVGRVSGAITGTITNAVTVSAATGDPDINNNTTTQDTTITLGTDLAITKTVAPNPALSNQNATFTLRPRNNGPFTADNVVVTDTLPAGFTYVSASGAGWTCGEAGGVVTCTRAGYTVGAADNIIITATAPTVLVVTPASNTAGITTSTPDPVSSNNNTTLNFNVVPDGVDLTLTKTKAPNPVAQGSNMTSTFVVHNNGPRAAAAGTITVTDILNNALETYSDPNYSGANWICSYAAPTITCTYNAALANGANTSSLIITTTAVGVGNITNTAVVGYSGTPGDWNSSNNDDDATVTSTAERADLTITKSATTPDSDTTLQVAENTITYTINVINNGPDPATGVVMTDPVAGYFSASTGVVVTSRPANYTCTTGGTVTCTQQSGILASGATDQFVIQVTRPLYDGTQTNTATVNSTVVGDPDRTNNSAQATVIIEPVCDVQMQNKTVSPGAVPAGTDATYVLTFRNNGPSTAANVVVTDDFNLPAGGDTNFTFISATPTEGSCSWDDGTKILTCNGITLNNGEARTVTVIIRPNWQAGDPVRTINNTATITTTTVESNAANNSRTQTLSVTSSDLDLLVNKTDLVDPIGFESGVPANNTITYLVRINNRGSSLATGLTLTDTMTPKNGKTLTFLGDKATPSGPIAPLCNNVGSSITGPATQTITCNFPDLAANTSYDRYLDFEVVTAPDPTGDTHNNIATISVNEHDRLPANNSEAETTSVRMRVDLSVTKAPASNPVQLREPFNWTIIVTNNGPGDSTQTTVTDTLPAGMAFSGAAPSWVKTGTSPGSGTCTTAGQNLTCNLGMLSSTGNATITTPVRVTAYPGGGSATNCTTATTDQFDPNAANNTNQCGTVTVQRSSLAGYVYRDLNDNGAMEGGETGINGVLLTLTGTDLYGNAVNRTTTTNGSGAYLFDNLSPSDGSGYTVTETQPALSYFDGLDSRDNGASAIPGSRTTDVIANIIVPANTALTGYLFGEIPAASLAGYVWNDQDNDGVRDAGETTGIPNTLITLTGTDYVGNPVNVNTTTNASGAYGFGPLRAGTYTVTETQPAAWADGLDSAGSAGGTVGNDVISAVVLNTTTIAVEYDFGEIGGSLAGIVYNDINNDGVRAPAEPGIPNATITLTGTDVNGTAINRVATTAADGSYSFTNLPMPNATGYTITETQPAGWNDGLDAVGSLGGTLGNDVLSAIVFPTPGAAGINYNFGERQGAAGVAQVSGTVWLDLDHQRDIDAGEPLMANWIVELIQRALPTDTTYTLIATTTTNAAGAYAITGVSPGTYEIRFRHSPGGYIYGMPLSAWPGVDLTYGTIRNLTLVAGDNAVNQNLPLDPLGVVYDAITRVPVAGATITISGPAGFNPALHLVGGAANVSQTTGINGLYQFQLLAAAPVGTYTLAITGFPAQYLPTTSAIIPPCAGPLTVLAAPAPAVVQNNAGPPATSTPGVCPADSGGLAAGAGTTQYFLSFVFTPGVSANVVNNHIPLDPAGEALLIAKSVNKKTATVGDLLFYTLTIRNTTSAILSDVTIRDNIPPGFKYRDGSARLDGQPITPVGSRPIEFQGITFAANQTRTITYVLIVGSGVQEGEYENTAFAIRGGLRISNIASAEVCVVKDPIFDLMTIIGKVFHDKNADGVQDEGEEGIALAKVVSVRGEIVTTDEFGRYHIAGVDAGTSYRGKNYILKVDPQSLPTRASFTTDNPRVIRITPGLMEKINFGVRFPADMQKPNTSTEPVKAGGGGSVAHPSPASGSAAVVTLPAGITAAPSRAMTAPAVAGTTVAPPSAETSRSNATPAQTGKGVPSISVTQDRLLAKPKLNLSIANDTIVRTGKGLKDNIAFFIYTNYPDFVEEYKIIIYAKKDFEGKYPLKTISLKKANNYEPVHWDGVLNNGAVLEQNQEYKYILEAYGKSGERDATLPKFFTVIGGPLLPDKNKEGEKAKSPKLIPGFGADNTAQRGIIPKGEEVVIYGKDLAPTDKVYIDDQPVAVDADGRFIAESYKSAGAHESTIVVKDTQGEVKSSRVEKVTIAGEKTAGEKTAGEKEGPVKAFFKDFFQDFFIIGILDLSVGQYSFRGHIEPVAQDDHYDEKVYVDGRAAFYLKGKIKGKYLLTAYLDTEDGEIQDIYKRLRDKDPKRIFRNLDPDRYYPVYGDDSTLVSDVETQGRFYVRIEWDKSKILWGNYNTQITGTELARYNRSLYGAKIYYESVAQTKFGDSKGIVTGFVSEAQTLQDHNEFLSTGGSLYYLRHQRVVEGSEKVSILVRDKDSGRVKDTATLTAGADYSIDYYQGRILLNSPLPIIANSNTIVSSALLNGDSVSLVADYEYNSECFGCNDTVENVTGGARGFWWVFDQFGVGSTFVREKRDDKDYNLYGVDAKIKLFKGTYTNFEFASSQQTQIPGSFSVDGGLNFSPIKTSANRDRGNAYKIGQVIDVKEFTAGRVPLDLSAYYIFREQGFSSLDKDTEHDTTEIGVNLQYDFAKSGTFRLKHSTFDEKDAFFESTSTAQLEWRWTERFRSFFEVRYKKLKEEEGYVQTVHPEDDHVLDHEEDVIGAVKVVYDFSKGTQIYAAQQVTLYKSHDTPQDNKTTIGISSQLTRWLKADVEGFAGDLGYGGRVGLTTAVNDKLNTYTSYMLSTDRTEGRAQRVTLGSTYRMNDKTDLYSENQFKDSTIESANSEIVGIKYRPTQRWNIDIKYENSHVTKDTVDSYVEQNIIRRDVGSVGVTYNHGQLKASSRIELRFDRGDEDENQYVTTNSIKYTLNKEWTFLGNLNFSLTRNITNDIDDAHFFEISTGLAYRPVKLDRLNMLFKYTYLEDLPPLSQIGNIDVAERSHVVSLEGIYDLSRYFSFAGKAAYKVGQMRLGRTSGPWVSSDTILFAGRVNYQFIKNWDASLEYRFLEVMEAKDYKHGPVVSLYRHIGDHVMVGVGYNFTDFNDDLTDLSYKAGGWFVNFVATW
jgi:uncharacterized repeat protein (TIGR01451 family)